MSYQPFKVSCTAVAGVASDGYLPLDGILAALWMREHHPDAYYNNSVAAKAELIEADLPLERRGSGQDWYYACSFCEAKWAEESVTHWHKRSTLNERIRYLGTDAGKLDVSKGETKAYRMPLYLLHAGERLTWYAVGDMAWVTDRIETVTTIGKKRTAGHGAVVDWQVEPVTEDWSVAKGERLMRAVPFGEAPSVVTEFAVGSYALRTPYWHYDHQRPNLLIPALPRAA